MRYLFGGNKLKMRGTKLALLFKCFTSETRCAVRFGCSSVLLVCVLRSQRRRSLLLFLSPQPRVALSWFRDHKAPPRDAELPPPPPSSSSSLVLLTNFKFPAVRRASPESARWSEIKYRAAAWILQERRVVLQTVQEGRKNKQKRGGFVCQDHHGRGRGAPGERDPSGQRLGPTAAAPALRFKRDPEHGAGLCPDPALPPVGEFLDVF